VSRPVASRLEDRSFYLCTPDRPDLVEFVGACIEGGVDVVQLREKVLEARRLVERARLVAELCRERGVPFILNDRPDLALEVGADGVHVGQDDVTAHTARTILGEGGIVGLSTHRRSECRAAGVEPIDYLSAGPVVETPTKQGRPGTGLGYLDEAHAIVESWTAPLPVFVTGGVSPDTIGTLVAHGARHFVVVRYLTESGDPRSSAQRLVEALAQSLGERTETPGRA
jgi:thiamine-phosphate pyrophosphorylase